MLALHFGIDCSRRCELLLAFSYLHNPRELIPIASRLQNDERNSARLLAKALDQVSANEANHLARMTLIAAGVLPEKANAR